MSLTYLRRCTATEVLTRVSFRCSWSSFLHTIAARASPLHLLVSFWRCALCVYFLLRCANCLVSQEKPHRERNWHMPPRSSSCACLFQHCSCEDCSFVWPPSPTFLFHAFPFNINSFFTILRRAARLLCTVTDVAIHGCPHGRVGNERVHIGFLMSGTDHVTRRCIDLVAGVPSWYYLSQRP